MAGYDFDTDDGGLETRITEFTVAAKVRFWEQEPLLQDANSSPRSLGYHPR